MTIDEIKAALKEKDVDGVVITAIDALDQSGELTRLKSELESEQGKNAGILADKKKFKERAETAEASLKKIEDDKLPADERHAKQLQDMQDKLDGEKAEREKQSADFKATQRDVALSDITGSIKWASGTPQDTAKLVIKNALSGVEDLSDKSKVDEILSSIKETHKTFIAADAPGGTGGKQMGGEKGSGTGDKPATMQELVDDAWAK